MKNPYLEPLESDDIHLSASQTRKWLREIKARVWQEGRDAAKKEEAEGDKTPADRFTPEAVEQGCE